MTLLSASEVALDLIASAERAVRYDGHAGTAEVLDPQILALVSAPVKAFDDIKALAWIAHCQMQLAIDEAADMGVRQRALYMSRNALFRVADELGVLNGPPMPGNTQ
ncbi:hypothetical protein LGR54_17870 [Ancylobacter sp. Lp-2]|uniref:hypothetical protein n=1 Tax=Ancylobacter sp. Lp-2 TaxID=2881339 RepID=UPI001E2D50D6|nr:hypothetical protein [Ancylobacter sp. Lp-2]MCB4770480.1 hypothetical protein [Ancylobacter sp. Lp-2]